MKKFLETNTITHNLMSFSGFKSLLIFSLLAESPKSYDDIKVAVEKNEYLRETMSTDTIRIYINSLKQAGCSVKCITENRKKKYYIDSSPFELKIFDQHVKSIIKIYKAISKSIEIGDFLALQQFFNKLSPYIKNEYLKSQLNNLSPLNGIDSNLINELMKYASQNTDIRILYYSKVSGEKKIDIKPDKLSILNGKLYLFGYSMEHENYSSFLVLNIKGVAEIHNKLEIPELPQYVVKYEYLKGDNMAFEPLDCEKIIEENDEKAIIEITSKNKFMITQRILSLTNHCRIISPEKYKEEIIQSLKNMKGAYICEK